MFPADGRLIPPTELLHGCPVLLEPGQFAQPQSVFGGMLTAALGQLRTELDAEARPPASLYVLPMRPAGEDATALAPPRSCAGSTSCGRPATASRLPSPRALPHDRARESLHARHRFAS